MSLKQSVSRLWAHGPREAARRLLWRVLYGAQDRLRTPLMALRTRPAAWQPLPRLEPANTFFDARELPRLWPYVQRLMYEDDYLFHRLLDRRIQGLRNWEYAHLMARVVSGDGCGAWRVLDVGPGNSTFPAFLGRYVGRVVTIDYPRPLEDIDARTRRTWREMGILVSHGTMERLPFGPDLFDLVTCISTIEHLDESSGGVFLPYEVFLQRVRRSLRELCRVIRPGGYLYLTTEAYVPELQRGDRWWNADARRGIVSAFRIGDIPSVFLDTIAGLGFQFVGPVDLDPSLLIQDQARSIFRGRYFTSLRLLAQRAGTRVAL